MRECSIVVHSNYSEGTDAYAFYAEADARRSVDEDVGTVVKDLIEQRYEPKTLRNGCGDNVTIYVPDSDIYYEWCIITSDIR